MISRPIGALGPLGGNGHDSQSGNPDRKVDFLCPTSVLNSVIVSRRGAESQRKDSGNPIFEPVSREAAKEYQVEPAD